MTFLTFFGLARLWNEKSLPENPINGWISGRHFFID